MQLEYRLQAPAQLISSHSCFFVVQVCVAANVGERGSQNRAGQQANFLAEAQPLYNNRDSCTTSGSGGAVV